MSDRWRELYAEECKRREDVEEELYQERLQHTAAVTRAEQAERERGAAKSWGTGVERAARDNMKALEERVEQAERERDEAVRIGAVGTYERDELNREIQRLSEREQAAIDSIARSGVAAEHGLLHAVDGLLAARERAEAANAALFEAFRAAHDPHVLGCSGAPCACGAIRVMDAQHPGAALLERLRAADKVLAGFREYEWERMDWQGTCPFRRHQDVRCRGTDGHVSAVGTPKPVPHSECCPYHALAALKERKP